MKTAADWEGSLSDFLAEYQYQPQLTKHLDTLVERAFDQTIINEIVLWKVNRYAPLSPKALDLLNGASALLRGAHREATAALAQLLHEPGVDLPMASTFLRFRNPRAFQIIDRHAYRAVYGDDYPLYPASNARSKIDVYCSYLDELIRLADSRRVAFELLDRMLYVFDKRTNGPL